MKLYRGDKITNSTEPGRYRFDGISSKSFGRGSPRNINAEVLLASIRQHIDPVDYVDRAIYTPQNFYLLVPQKIKLYSGCQIKIM